MTQRLEFVVYLSSTLADLGPERELALKTIAEVGRVQTSFRASEEGVVETCVGDVRKCALYVGILGRRYGYVPPDAQGNPKGLSITELEYESCRTPGKPEIPRLLFIKPAGAGIPDEHIDAFSNPETAERMKAFLARAQREQTAYVFRNADDLRAELRIRVMEHADRFHRENTNRKLTFHDEKQWSRQLAPVFVMCVRGTDHARRDEIAKAGGHRFRAGDLQVKDDDFMATLDGMLQQAQVACLLVTPAALGRLKEVAPGGVDCVERVAQALRTMRLRLGVAAIICEGVPAADLPAAWECDVLVELPAGQLLNAAPAALDAIYERLKTDVQGLTVEPRLAVPYVVIAPTRTEAADLCDGTALEKFADPQVRELWRGAFERVRKAARQAVDAKWPEGTYGAQRHAWRCFGPNAQTASELLQRSVRRINEAPAGSRERRFLRTARLVLHRYELDEFLVDRWGSRRCVESLRDRGCLFIVDELALLHPDLRDAADKLLVGSKSAVVAVCPSDPAHTPTGLLLKEPSFLRVGTIVTRFHTEQDPRCEVALNSSDRVERWLRLAIPELIASMEELEGDPELVAQAPALLD